MKRKFVLAAVLAGLVLLMTASAVFAGQPDKNAVTGSGHFLVHSYVPMYAEFSAHEFGQKGYSYQQDLLSGHWALVDVDYVVVDERYGYLEGDIVAADEWWGGQVGDRFWTLVWDGGEGQDMVAPPDPTLVPGNYLASGPGHLEPGQWLDALVEMGPDAAWYDGNVQTHYTAD